MAGAPPAADGVEELAEEDDEEDDDEQEAKPLSLVIEAEGLELRQLHDLRAKLPLPITGQIDIEIALTSETGEFREAGGTISVNGVAIVLGNSEAQIEVGGMPMTVDEIAIAQVDCEVQVEQGTAEFTAFEMRSQDFDAKVQGSLTFGDPLSRSRLDLYLMFRFLDGYAAKSARAQMLISSLDDFSRDLKRAHRSDGYYGFRYRGMFGSARLSPSKTFRGERQRAADRRKKPRDRKRPGRAGAGLPSGPAGEPGLRQPPRGDPSGADLSGETMPGAPPPRPGQPLEPMPRPGLDNGPGRLRPGEDDGSGQVEEEIEEEAPDQEEAGEGEGSGEGEESGEEEGGGEEQGAGEEEGSGEGEESGEEEGGGEEEAAGEEVE
jgi:hypothetical protein